MKLSTQQLFVIKKMQEGHKLGCTGFDFKRIPSNTIESIRKLKLITLRDGSIFNYALTAKGKLFLQSN